MQEHPEIACGWFKGSKEVTNRVWRNLEAKLNSAGPPSKCIAEWKKVWWDRKKYVRHKAAQNFKAARGTGGGPNIEQRLTASEEAIYALIGMRESVEGVSRPLGLGSVSAPPLPESAPPPLPESAPPPLPESDAPPFPDSAAPPLPDSAAPPLPESASLMDFDDGGWMENDMDTTRKSQAKKIRLGVQSTHEVLLEQISIQKKMLEAMVVQHQMARKMYHSIDRLCDAQKEQTKMQKRSMDLLADAKNEATEEQKRHNLAMEKLRVREVEDKIEKNRRLLEIEDLKSGTYEKVVK